MNYEVITAQEAGNKARVMHDYFTSYEAARAHADIICDDPRTVRCSIYGGDILIIDVL